MILVLEFFCMEQTVAEISPSCLEQFAAWVSTSESVALCGFLIWVLWEVNSSTVTSCPALQICVGVFIWAHLIWSRGKIAKSHNTPIHLLHPQSQSSNCGAFSNASMPSSSPMCSPHIFIYIRVQTSSFCIARFCYKTMGGSFWKKMLHVLWMKRYNFYWLYSPLPLTIR